MRKQVGDRSFKFVDSLLALLIVSAATCGLAFAQERRTGGRTPSAEGAAVYFIDLKDGASVPTKVTIRFGLREMGVVPAGFDRENSGHHHLLIDTELPPLFEPIPNDFNHLHFGGGQTEAQVTLKPGPHTLQLLLGDKDHIPHNPPVMSSRIRIIVSNVTTASPQVASTAVRAQAPRPTKAQEKAIRSACLKDYMSHCSKVKPGPAGLACLKSNAASLSAGCQTALSAAGGESAAAGVAPASQGAPAPTKATLTPTQATPASAQDAGRSDWDSAADQSAGESDPFRVPERLHVALLEGQTRPCRIGVPKKQCSLALRGMPDGIERGGRGVCCRGYCTRFARGTCTDTSHACTDPSHACTGARRGRSDWDSAADQSAGESHPFRVPERLHVALLEGQSRPCRIGVLKK